MLSFVEVFLIMLFMNGKKLKDFEALKWDEEKASVLHYEERCLGRLMWWPTYERGVGGRWREGGEKGEDSSVESLNIWGGGCMVTASFKLLREDQLCNITMKMHLIFIC